MRKVIGGAFISLVTLAQYGYARRLLMLNLSRKEPAAFERQLRARLDEGRRQFPRPWGQNQMTASAGRQA